MRPRAALSLLAILLVALALRLQAVAGTEVLSPIRADAQDYVLYAHNLREQGVYTRADTITVRPSVPPLPDAVRPPGYPLFLLPFLSSPPGLGDLPAILRAQALLGALTVLLVFLIGRLVLPEGFALAAAALAALSPHLITVNVYMLSETLFGLLLALALYLACGLARDPTPARALFAGLALAAASLTHPLAVYFVVPLASLLLLHGRQRRPAVRATAALALGFAALYGVWTARNLIAIGASADHSLMLRTLRTGVYIDFLYEGRPETYAYPYRYDARFEQTTASLDVVLREIEAQFAAAPAEELSWYLRKPFLAWGWNEVQGSGDVFIYPVTRTPYAERLHFRASHLLMRTLHFPLVALMGVGVILAWLPSRWSRLGDDARFAARVLSLLVLYHAAMMSVGLPLPRYSIPLRPCLYVLAMLPLATAVRWRANSPAQPA